MVNDFVKRFYPAAKAAAIGSKVLPETIITAAALESGWNKSELSAKYNNFFGRKVEKGYKGKAVNLKTKEFIDGKWTAPVELFKVYNTPEDSFRDYVKLLTSAPRYKSVLAATTPQQQFVELQKAGYATAPTYATTLTSVLNRIRPHLAVSITGVLALATIFF